MGKTNEVIYIGEELLSYIIIIIIFVYFITVKPQLWIHVQRYCYEK